METPYPPSETSEDELNELKDSFNEYIPVNSMIVDLWDWDIHFEDHLSEEWYFDSVFGSSTSLGQSVDELVDFFLEKVDEYDMDYDQQNDPESFKQLVREEALSLITCWRENIFNRFVQQKASTDG